MTPAISWGRTRRPFAMALLAATAVVACNADLPEPESEAARLYAAKCNDCHRVYAPGLMKYEMWKITFERMEREIRRSGRPPLSDRERRILLDYLKRHSS